MFIIFFPSSLPLSKNILLCFCLICSYIIFFRVCLCSSVILFTQYLWYGSMNFTKLLSIVHLLKCILVQRWTDWVCGVKRSKVIWQNVLKYHFRGLFLRYLFLRGGDYSENRLSLKLKDKVYTGCLKNCFDFLWQFDLRSNRWSEMENYLRQEQGRELRSPENCWDRNRDVRLAKWLWFGFATNCGFRFGFVFTKLTAVSVFSVQFLALCVV